MTGASDRPGHPSTAVDATGPTGANGGGGPVEAKAWNDGGLPSADVPAGGGLGRQGGLTTEDLKSGAGVTGGPDVVGEGDSTRGISGGHAQGSATGGG